MSSNLRTQTPAAMVDGPEPLKLPRKLLGQMERDSSDDPLYRNPPSRLEDFVVSEPDTDEAHISLDVHGNTGISSNKDNSPATALAVGDFSFDIKDNPFARPMTRNAYSSESNSRFAILMSMVASPTTWEPYSSENQRPQSTLGTSPYRRKPIERSFLPVLIQDKRIEALPDTNATCNVITEQFAQSIGAHIDRSAARQCAFTNAIGLQSRSVGETSLQVAFPDNPLKTWQCTFAVIQNCPEGLVFGDHFLRVVTETVTKFRHRLKKAISTLAKRTWRLMHMQYPRQKLECFIDSGRVLANADTGSDVDLVSFNYAKLRGWDIDPLPHDEGFVILSDGTIAKVFGHVDVDLFLRGTINKGKRFYVLDGLISDVVLGDTTVDELDVFNAHIDSFVDLGEVEEVEDFFMIEWVQRLDKFEAHVDRLLVTHSTATGSPVAAPINTWGRIYRAAKRQGGREVDYKPEEIKAELRRRLQDLDIIEIQLSSQSSKKMGTLVGNELLREQADDRARKIRYRELRLKILRSISDLP